MKLFLAITFDNSVKERLVDMQEVLRSGFVHASFTERNKLHMTLHFFGEGFDNRLPTIKKIMDEINEPTFKLKIQGVGCFKHDRGDLWWAGVSDLECISHLHNAVCDGIRRSGLYYDFERQDFKFSPHITLARKVITKQNFDLVIINRDIKAISTQVEKIVLMDSEYVGGILSYTSVYEKQLF